MREVETQQRSRVIKLLPHLAEHLQRWQTRVTDFFIDKITFSFSLSLSRLLTADGLCVSRDSTSRINRVLARTFSFSDESATLLSPLSPESV
jgi:hypothetical protein